MPLKFSHDLTSYQTLLGIGITLVMVGLLLRGFANSATRDAARRKQHWLHVRKLGEADPSEKEISWFERRLPSIATAATVAGVVITAVSFFRN